MSEKLGTNLAEVGTDCISRQQAIDKFIDGLEEIFADLRERHVDDSVCGLCEYDGAYVGQSGEWCNECPGFDRDDCFKLSDKTRKEWTEEIIKALPPAQPEIIRCKNCKHWIPYDWMFSEVWQSKNIADYPEDEMGCDCCDMAMKANDFCSRGERRTDG